MGHPHLHHQLFPLHPHSHNPLLVADANHQPSLDLHSLPSNPFIQSPALANFVGSETFHQLILIKQKFHF
jgi:hypothetical protein